MKPTVTFNDRQNGCVFTFPDGREIECYINIHAPDVVTVSANGSFSSTISVLPIASNVVRVK